MSWSIEVVGTKAGVAKHVAESLDKTAKMYEGKEEAKDVHAAKERILAAVEAMDLEGQGYAVKVSASGSQSWTGKGAVYAVMRIEISRVVLAT